MGESRNRSGGARPETDVVRVRFAPSPTGSLHVGGARTAIFNWLLARRSKGIFILRIEDTDVERSTRESEASLLDDLRWLGLDWDEGPDVGGSRGPYRQSERLDRYKAEAETLVDRGLAYPCFCSDALLTEKRERARREGRPPQYDGTCRTLSPDAIRERRSQGLKETIRFRVPEGMVRIADLVRGDVEFSTDTVGDFVLMRSNGRPTYNFAAVVDDHAMEITHVLRGEEHLANTLRQELIYQALGAGVPTFGHLPLILAPDRSKLSKRHGSASVGELRQAGFLPEAVINYLVLLGWSHPEGKEVLAPDELADAFTVDRVNKAAAVYDPDKLAWMNGQYVRAMPTDTLFGEADRFFPADIRAQYDPNQRREILRLIQESVDRLDRLPELCAPFRSPPELDEEAEAVLRERGVGVVLARLADAVRRLDAPLTAEAFKMMMKTIGKETGLKGKALFFPVRAALTGSVHGPDLAGLAALRGRDAVSGLLEEAIRRIGE